MFTRAIASAVDLPVESVVKLEASEIEEGSGSRRLQSLPTSIQSKYYVVAYEIMVPSYMDPDLVVGKANRIATPGTSESLLFRDVLIATEGVANVGKIVSKIPAYSYKVDDTTATVSPSTAKDQEEDEKSWTALIVGAVTLSLVLLCLVSGGILVIKKMTKTGPNRAQPVFSNV